jgi:hypothetical protein
MLFLKCAARGFIGALLGLAAFFCIGIGIIVISLPLLLFEDKRSVDTFTQTTMAWAFLLIPVGLIAGIFQVIRRENARRREEGRVAGEKANTARLQAEELRNTHLRARNALKSVMVESSERALHALELIPFWLDAAENHLNRADADFLDSAFTPFWDSIESCANAISMVDQQVRSIGAEYAAYLHATVKYGGGAPNFAVSNAAVRNLNVSGLIARRMNETVRRAHRDYRFATIYEQRRTSALLVAGFANLAEALSSVGGNLEQAIGSLERTFSDADQTLERLSAQSELLLEVSDNHREDFLAAAYEQAGREAAVIELLNRIQTERV